MKKFTQRSAVLCRVGGAAQYSTLQCTANHQFESSELNCCALKLQIYFFNSEGQFNSMDKNVDLCSALEFITAHPA